MVLYPRMITNLRDVYAAKALSQIPRLLTLEDRNAYSPTYGCFKRTFWLDKTVDFPDALPQFGVLSLALAYTHPMPGNQFYQQPKILDWTLAGMKYWMGIQHGDGSFDEFYPNERGWAGPTGFLLYAMLKSYMLLKDRNEFPASMEDGFLSGCQKAAEYLIAWDEQGVLANHHAMAVLPVFYASHVLKLPHLGEGYERKLAEFMSFCKPEGWSVEYDGADIGYLSATVSFLGKIYKINHDPRLKDIMTKAVEFLSYFVYPNGFYAGSMGSRQTLHFYPHGCEILAKESSLARRIADALLSSLRDGKIVPAEIMDDRYFLYRIPEHLESYIDYGERTGTAMLPFERDDFRTVFPDGRFYVEKKGPVYLLGNAAKGGVTKAFDTRTGSILLNDCGIMGELTDGTVVTSQWIDPDLRFVPKEHGFSVSGALHRVSANKVFTPITMILFRLFMLAFGWNTALAYRIKGFIRNMLMLKSGRSDVLFYRCVELTDDALIMTDKIILNGNARFRRLQVGDEFFTRYVPQSRYFQSQELDIPRAELLSPALLQTLHADGRIHLERRVTTATGDRHALRAVPMVIGTMGFEYSDGRKERLALRYRLRRRGEELIGGIRTFLQGTPRDILDMGSAEGRTLSMIQDTWPHAHCVGLEYAQDLIDACTDERLDMVRGDVLSLPFPDASFDAVTASAIIEHVESPNVMLQEAFRVLRPGGVLIITTPDPFFERIASAIGHLAGEHHQETMTLKTLESYLKGAGFDIALLEKFMVSPWGMPGERSIETIMKKIGLGALLLNELSIGIKPAAAR